MVSLIFLLSVAWVSIFLCAEEVRKVSAYDKEHLKEHLKEQLKVNNEKSCVCVAVFCILYVVFVAFEISKCFQVFSKCL
jgi:hypothetical protein